MRPSAVAKLGRVVLQCRPQHRRLINSPPHPIPIIRMVSSTSPDPEKHEKPPKDQSAEQKESDEEWIGKQERTKIIEVATRIQQKRKHMKVVDEFTSVSMSTISSSTLIMRGFVLTHDISNTLLANPKINEDAKDKAKVLELQKRLQAEDVHMDSLFSQMYVSSRNCNSLVTLLHKAQLTCLRRADMLGIKVTELIQLTNPEISESTSKKARKGRKK